MDRKKIFFITQVYLISLGRSFEENDIKSTVNVLCSSKSILPDPYSCIHFLVCQGPNQQVATRYVCPENSRFDPQRLYCVSEKYIHCSDIRGVCSRYSKGTVVEHPIFQGLYAACGTNFIQTCPKHHYRPVGQTILSKKCKFRCPGEGFFAEPTLNGEIYHACVMEGSKYVDHIRVCENGTVFSESHGFCIQKAPTPVCECQMKEPSTQTPIGTTQIRLEGKSSEIPGINVTESPVQVTSTKSNQVQKTTIGDISPNQDNTGNSDQSITDGGFWGV